MVVTGLKPHLTAVGSGIKSITLETCKLREGHVAQDTT